MTLNVRAIARIAVAAVVALGIGQLSVQAQKPQTGSEFYVAYRAAFDKAKKIEDIYPFMSAARVKEMKSTPAEDRAMMFDMIKEMGALTGVKVLKETAAANGASLNVEGVSPDKSKQTGTISLVKEAGAWKIDKESWKN